MANIYIFGSSTAYGVGGSEGGWGDMIKRYLHKKMYEDGGIGEKHDIYNFSKPGALVSFVQETLSSDIDRYSYPNTTLRIALVNIGGNNSKAHKSPTDFVSTPEEFEKEYTEFLSQLKKKVNHIIVIASPPKDEAKTMPRISPSGKTVYFSNERSKLFNDITQKVCESFGATYIDLGVSDEEWVEKYIYVDGLHPNNAGYTLMFEKIKDALEKVL